MSNGPLLVSSQCSANADESQTTAAAIVLAAHRQLWLHILPPPVCNCQSRNMSLALTLTTPVVPWRLQTTYQTSHGQLLDLITAPIGTERPVPQAPCLYPAPANLCLEGHSLRPPVHPQSACTADSSLILASDSLCPDTH